MYDPCNSTYNSYAPVGQLTMLRALTAQGASWPQPRIDANINANSLCHYLPGVQGQGAGIHGIGMGSTCSTVFFHGSLLSFMGIQRPVEIFPWVFFTGIYGLNLFRFLALALLISASPIQKGCGRYRDVMTPAK